MFSRRTRILGLTFCALWVLLFTGALRPILRPTLTWALDMDAPSESSSRATAPQYLPWAAGRTVYVHQGNHGQHTHRRPQTRHGWDFGLLEHEPVLSGVVGTVVTAAGGCDVVASPDCGDGWGNTVVVRLQDRTCARFGHLGAIAVTRGQMVLLGTPVGTNGSSGNSTGFHLHYQREVCSTGETLPSRFVDAGVPLGGSSVTSRLPATQPVG